MSFERSWVALLAVAPWIWFWFESRRNSRRIAIACKAASLCAILLALSEPRLVIDETKMHVSVLVDTSASLSDEGLEKASAIAASIQGSRGRHEVRVMPFARDTREPAAREMAAP
jgi:hypothetical protein